MALLYGRRVSVFSALSAPSRLRDPARSIKQTDNSGLGRTGTALYRKEPETKQDLLSGREDN